MLFWAVFSTVTFSTIGTNGTEEEEERSRYKSEACDGIPNLCDVRCIDVIWLTPIEITCGGSPYPHGAYIGTSVRVSVRVMVRVRWLVPIDRGSEQVKTMLIRRDG